MRFIKKRIWSSVVVSIVAVAATPVFAFAHVVVKPSQVNVGQEVLFTVSVPNERESPVTDVRLTIPVGVTDVTPTVTSDWLIAITKDTSIKDPEVTTIEWKGGNIPVGQREDFSFSAQAPANATNLNWKAYQAYADGSVVHWDQVPSGSDDASGLSGPYSVTHVVNDLDPSTKGIDTSSLLRTAFLFSIIAIVLSLGALFLQKRKPNTEKAKK